MRVVVDDKHPDMGGNVRHGDLGTWCPDLWNALIDLYAIRTMLDVGCGEGHTVAYFNRIGVYGLGIEGLQINIKRAVFPIAAHDIMSGPFIMPIDLVWSAEVAEHIPESHVQNYLKTLANGRVVAITHATPGQSGHHHVNCQTDEYWISAMRQEGYSLSNENNFFRELAGRFGGGTYFVNSGLVFLRD